MVIVVRVARVMELQALLWVHTQQIWTEGGGILMLLKFYNFKARLCGELCFSFSSNKFKGRNYETYSPVLTVIGVNILLNISGFIGRKIKQRDIRVFFSCMAGLNLSFL